MSSSSPPAYDSDPTTLLRALLTTIETHIIPLTTQAVSSGNKLFGASILSKRGLTPLTTATNAESASPLLHGEINCIQTFFAQTSFPLDPSDPTGPALSAERPDPRRDCVFLSTHEPCSLCLSGIAWSGFDAVFHLFTHEDSRDLFAIPHDIDILQEVFRVPAVLLPPPGSGSRLRGQEREEETAQKRGEEGEEEDLDARPLYNRRNKYFTARSFADLVKEIADGQGAEEGARWADEVRRVKALYNGLSDTYQKGKEANVKSASFWK